MSGLYRGVGVVAFCWFLLCGGDYRRNCLVDWVSYWLDWFVKLVECSLAVEVSLDPTHRSVVEKLSETLPYSGQLALGMAPVGSTQCDKRWRSMLSLFDKQYETLIANNPDATEEINLIRIGLIKTGKLIQTSPQQIATAQRGSDWPTKRRMRNASLVNIWTGRSCSLECCDYTQQDTER
jgi:hypothetical protein